MDFSILLIDFGGATKYIDKAGKHLAPDEVDCFNGSITFASLNQMNNNSTSRRDDIIQLTYALFCMLNNFHYPFYNQNYLDDFNDYKTKHFGQYFLRMKMFKQQNNLGKMSVNLNIYNLPDDIND